MTGKSDKGEKLKRTEKHRQDVSGVKNGELPGNKTFVKANRWGGRISNTLTKEGQA